jgi:hypothetical protein
MGIKSALDEVRAALGAPLLARKDVSVETRVIKPTSVMALIAEIREATDAHGGIVESQAAANAHADGLATEIGRLSRGIAGQERALAVSGAPLPADPFPEEAQISRLQRELRVVKARVTVLAESAEANQSKLSELREALRGAWHDFAVATCKEQRERFRAAGLVLRGLYAEQLACLTAFGATQGVPAAAIAIVEDPESRGMEHGLCDHRFLARQAVWEKPAVARYEELSALRAEVEGACGRR